MMKIFISIVLLITWGLQSGCRKDPANRNPVTFKFIPPSREMPLIVWVKPGASPDAFKRWKDSLQILYPGQNLDTVKTCSGCDNNLMLLSGLLANTYVTQQTASGGNGSPGKAGVSGEDGDILFSVNFPVDMNDSILPNATIDPGISLPRRPGKDPVTVAIFDTGVYPDVKLSGLFYNNPNISCLGPGSNNGWSFPLPHTSYTDDHIGKHGTVVSAFIADQVHKYGNNSVNILPVKTHATDGRSDLFSILCGLSYAVERGAKVINASFGFYAPRHLAPSSVFDSSAYLLKKFIEYHLLPKNILLVAAAGNRDDRNEDIVYFPADRLFQRDLEKVSFYPASLARELRNVIAVTTVNNTGAVSGFQNYSPATVDVGVYADRASDFAFENPINAGHPVIGSSFAAPIVTGRICANYNLLIPLLAGGAYAKEDIWRRLGTGLVQEDNRLRLKIKNGVVMSK